MDFEKLLNPLGECFNPPFEEYLFSSTFFALGQDIVHKGAVMMSLTCSDQTVLKLLLFFSTLLSSQRFIKLKFKSVSSVN